MSYQDNNLSQDNFLDSQYVTLKEDVSLPRKIFFLVLLSCVSLFLLAKVYYGHDFSSTQTPSIQNNNQAEINKLTAKIQNNLMGATNNIKFFQNFLMVLFVAFLSFGVMVVLFLLEKIRCQYRPLRFSRVPSSGLEISDEAQKDYHLENFQEIKKGAKTFFPPFYLIEIFTIYLCLMLASTFVGERINFDKLLLSILLIPLSLLGIFWPTFFGYSLQEIFSRLGVSLRGFFLGTFLKNAFIGVFTYLAGIIPLVAFILCYALILDQFKVSPASGAHPIFPLLAGNSADNTFLKVFILAVIIAPIVEEIMFRGVLYSWFRSKFGFLFSAFCCSLIFAGLHPQGLIGVPILMCISFMLCFLREWRSSLTACMFAHACVNGVSLLTFKGIMGLLSFSVLG